MQRRPSTKLRPSPSSVSSHSNTSSLFRDDGFEDDFTSNASESTSNWVVAEIVETERAYVEDLEQIVNGYIRHLRQALKLENHERRITQDSISTRDSHELDLDSSININSNADHEDGDIDGGTNGNVHHTSDPSPQPQQTATNGAQTTTTTPFTKADTAISACHIKQLFSNLEEIYKFNKDLLFRLEECYRNPSSIAEVFVENAAGFDIYTHYCTMYPQVVTTLTELMSDQASAEILRQRQSSLRQALPLGSYLLKPVQRILKYHILFQSLIKHTSDDDSIREKDRQLIDEAYSVMTNVACHINEMKKKHEHAIRVQEVQSLLHGWPSGPDLTTMGELILEETFVIYNKPKTLRHVFLFENVVLITKKKSDGSLWYKGHIACTNLMLIEKFDGEPLVFHIVPFDSPKSSFALQAKNLEKKLNWCIQMKEVIIKSFQIQIPNHVKDILMSLTNNTESVSKSSSAGKAARAPDYLQRKRTSLTKKK